MRNIGLNKKKTFVFEKEAMLIHSITYLRGKNIQKKEKKKSYFFSLFLLTISFLLIYQMSLPLKTIRYRKVTKIRVAKHKYLTTLYCYLQLEQGPFKLFVLKNFVEPLELALGEYRHDLRNLTDEESIRLAYRIPTTQTVRRRIQVFSKSFNQDLKLQ
jgi:hypothetical protein